jgi:hypothetical protein
MGPASRTYAATNRTLDLRTAFKKAGESGIPAIRDISGYVITCGLSRPVSEVAVHVR